MTSVRKRTFIKAIWIIHYFSSRSFLSFFSSLDLWIIARGTIALDSRSARVLRCFSSERGGQTFVIYLYRINWIFSLFYRIGRLYRRKYTILSPAYSFNKIRILLDSLTCIILIYNHSNDIIWKNGFRSFRRWNQRRSDICMVNCSFYLFVHLHFVARFEYT